MPTLKIESDSITDFYGLIFSACWVFRISGVSQVAKVMLIALTFPFSDYVSSNNESIHQVMRTFSDLGKSLHSPSLNSVLMET